MLLRKAIAACFVFIALLTTVSVQAEITVQQVQRVLSSSPDEAIPQELVALLNAERDNEDGDIDAAIATVVSVVALVDPAAAPNVIAEMVALYDTDTAMAKKIVASAAISAPSTNLDAKALGNALKAVGMAEVVRAASSDMSLGIPVVNIYAVKGAVSKAVYTYQTLSTEEPETGEAEDDTETETGEEKDSTTPRASIDLGSLTLSNEEAAPGYAGQTE